MATKNWTTLFKEEIGLGEKDDLPETLNEVQKGRAFHVLGVSFPKALASIARFLTDAGSGGKEERDISPNSELDHVTQGEGVDLLNLASHNRTHPLVVFERAGSKFTFWSPTEMTRRGKKSPCGDFTRPGGFSSRRRVPACI